MTDKNKTYLIALSYFPKFGPARLKRLKNFFPSWEEAFSAPLADLTAAGIEPALAENFIVERQNINPEKIMADLEKEKISAISLDEENYPPLLKQIYDPPFLLYYQGVLTPEEKTLAVVGARKCTPYGQRAIDLLLPAAIKYGITIVSGLALGIDALAHSRAILENGKTIGIIGSGLDKNSFYPPQNKLLAEKIISSGGALVSEFAPGTPPLKQNFPQRNRIIAGWAKAVLVVEAEEKSGSLITARFALEEGREVLAVPGSISFSTSAGPNNLIKHGAKMITGANDILEIFGFGSEPEEKIERDWSGLSPVEREILLNLSGEPRHLDEIAGLTKLDMKTINSTLSILEIKGIARNTGGGNYVLM